MRLKRGRANRETVFSDDPVAVGRKWQEAGARWLHAVDLDGAFSSRQQSFKSIQNLRQALAIPLQLKGAAAPERP